MRAFRIRFFGVLILCAVSTLGIAQDLRVTLLGSGGNFPEPGRLGPSILVEADGKAYIFDAGRGVVQRLANVGLLRDEISGVFFTHLHSDHVVGFPGLWLGGWLFSRRDTPWQIFGPAGTQNMVEHLRLAFSFDIDIRISDDGVPASGIVANVTEVEDGYIWEDGNVIIRAIEVDHRPIEPAFGYRIDVGDYSVALSGDTRYSESFIAGAQGVDLLIHEVSDASQEFLAANPHFRDVVRAHHTTAPEAGQVFATVRPKLAVYAHMVITDISYEQLIEMTRSTYEGPLIVGEDLMSFQVGEEISIVMRQ